MIDMACLSLIVVFRLYALRLFSKKHSINQDFPDLPGKSFSIYLFIIGVVVLSVHSVSLDKILDWRFHLFS